jgi:hypothetical protein
MDEEIPADLLAKHPALAAVAQALRQNHAGDQVTARCVKCGATLELVDVPETGVLVVLCPNGDTYFRARRAKQGADTP